MSEQGELEALEEAEESEPDIAGQAALVVALVVAAKKRLTEIMGSVSIENLTQTQQNKVISEVNSVLNDLDDELETQVSESVKTVYEHGRARALVSLGLHKNVKSALKYLRSDSATWSRAHRAVRNSEIETTMDDLLTMTSNTRRKVKSEIRRVAAEVYRSDENARAQRNQLSAELKEAGIFAIRDSANRQWKIDHYAEVVITTKLTETHRYAAEQEASEQGAGYVVISRHGDACSKCQPWQGRLLRISDSVDGDQPTLATAISAGLFHPMCKHSEMPVKNPEFVPDWVIT